MRGYRRIGVLLAALAVVPLVIGNSGSLMNLAVTALAFALFAVAVNISFGHTDQLFLFVGGLSGIGAYVTVIPASTYGLSIWLTLPLGMAVCGLLAGLVSYVSARRNFTVIVIAILTLNLQLAFTSFFVGASSITGGSTGYFFDSNLIPEPVIRVTEEGLGLEASVALYYLLVVVVGATLVGYVRLVNSRYGMAFDAIREDELAAEATGVNVVRYKTVAGVVTGCLIGLGGVLYVHQGLTEVVSPGQFTFLSVDVLVLIMLVLGGLRTTVGPVVGAVIVVVIEELLKRTTEFQTAIFGAVLIVLFLYFRRGIVPTVTDMLERRGLVGRGTDGPESGEEPTD